MAFSRYIATEIAADHADGLIPRREALRRLALLGLGAASASALLAACSSDDTDEAKDPATPSTAATTGTTTAATTATTATTGAGGGGSEAITFKGPSGELRAAWAPAAEPKGAVLLIHENRGLTNHFKALPGRLAGDGYPALCVDLLSKEGGTASFTDPAQATAALGAAPRDRLIGDLRAGLDELLRRVGAVKPGVMGFCFGGGLTWSLLAAGEARLAAAVPFYGPLPDPHDFSKAKAAVLAIYGELDTFVNPSRDEATAALERSGLVHKVITYPGAGHAFLNDTSPRYNATAAAAAYREVLDWFGRYLGRA